MDSIPVLSHILSRPFTPLYTFLRDNKGHISDEVLCCVPVKLVLPGMQGKVGTKSPSELFAP